ncbi:DUF4861 family protein [Alteromonas lipolytica]|uniref:DUF4861 domain-containing protein n=1 Tax=Alteromonas lipolytica TaxID=1856405 RepID=A0A1E8FI31_9ALTE|nr:DUF4861 family protein [Alteromonas lipolytica]OFI35554.1 hypothetical protein BFC17_12390 [Alteromonas lipolytica]GGF77153.1 hypothetical protein GCM10011338_31800 [Alteromonas lipolytica]
MKRYFALSLLAASTLLSACSQGPQSQDNSAAPTTEPVIKTHAELSVREGGAWDGNKYVADGFQFAPVTSFTAPAQLTDHSYFLRYEGPGWENDQIGYRLYLDWRNGIDIFVKTTNEMVLSRVGQDGYDSYHELSDWGGDALKVGKSVGLGALGRWLNDGVSHFKQVGETQWQLITQTPTESAFEVSYKEWVVGGVSADVSTLYSIKAGDPSTLVNVTTSQPLDNLVTGLVRHNNVAYIEKESDNWKMIATYGKQNLLGDNLDLGMALFVRKSDIADQFEGPHDYLFKFKPATQYQYGFFASWPGHPDQPQNRHQFEAFMEAKLASLESSL